MNYGQALAALVYQALRASTELAALVGARIYDTLVPLDADMPCVVFTVLAPDAELSAGGDVMMAVADLQVKALGAGVNRNQVEQIAGVARAALATAATGVGDKLLLGLVEDGEMTTLAELQRSSGVTRWTAGSLWRAYLTQ